MDRKSSKRKLEDIEDVEESKEVYEDAPAVLDRVTGKKYLLNGTVRLWTGNHWHCEHGKETAICKVCTPPRHSCEKCGLEFWFTTDYEQHLQSEVHLLDPEELKRVRKERGSKAIETADKVEQYIDSLVKTLPEIEMVERYANTGCKLDTVLKFRDETFLRGLQTKALIERKTRKDNYSIATGKSKYEDDTLIVGVNMKSGVHYAVSWKSIKDLGTINFSPRGKWSKCLYWNKEKFLEALPKLLRTTTILKDDDPKNYLSEDAKLEYESLERLSAACAKLGLSYERNSTNGNSIDVFIAGKKIQCKSALWNRGKTCSFFLWKKWRRQKE